MTALWFIGILALVFAVVWINLARNQNPKARIGPDGTNVRKGEPETFVVHHEGKGQGIDIANTALKKRTEDVRRDLPGDTHKIKTPVPGRDMTRMDAPPSDISKYGDEKVAPGAEPKEKVLTEGPIGSRPGTPEEPGSPYAKGRRVTDTHRDVELAEEVLPNAFPGHDRRVPRDMAASPATTGQEPGYGLGRTAPGETDGEGGLGTGGTPEGRPTMGRVIQFRGRAQDEEAVEFQPDPTWTQEVAEELNWSDLQQEPPLPAAYGEDAVVTMVRNPRSLYVYWEREGFGEENLKSMLGQDEWQKTKPVLRVFDVTSGAYPGQEGGHTFTIAISEQDDHWFINDGIEPGHRYVVSYERATADGRLYMMSHSAPVETPQDNPNDAGALYQMYGRQPGEWSGSPWR